MQGIDSSGPATPDPEPAEASAHCPWCSAAAPAGTARCPSCGAALIESETIGSYGIPGVTSVDRGVVAGEESARRQLKRQARGPHVLGTALGFAGIPLGGVIGSAIEDIVAARAGGPSGDANKMGIMDLLELERKPEPGAEATNSTTAGATSAQLADPWVDLPPPAIEDQIEGTDFDPWATRDQSAGGAFDPWANRTDPWASPEAAASPGGPARNPGGLSPSGPAPGDPWSFEDGPWSQDPWGQRDDGPGSDPTKRR